MEEQSAPRDDERQQLAAAVRRNPIAWSALGTPAMLLLVLLVMAFGANREPAMPGSSVAILAVFILVSLAEVLVIPWYFLDQAGKNLAVPVTPEQVRSFTNFYGIAMLGGTTPCVLGLVYYVLSGNLLLALLLYAIGLAHLFYCWLRTDAVIARCLERAPEPQGGN